MTDEHNGHDHVAEEDQSALASMLVEDPTPPDLMEMSSAELAEAQKASLTEKIRFVWRPEDQGILTRIEVAAEQQFSELFADAMSVIGTLYAALRVPDGRGGWMVYDNGTYVERWDQMTGQDIERAIMDLMRIKLVVGPAVNKLKSRAVYAKMVADDSKDDAYRSVVAGTIGDRTAKANRESRQDRYHAFFNYCVWSVADAFLREIIDLMYRLRDVRNWRVQAER